MENNFPSGEMMNIWGDKREYVYEVRDDPKIAGPGSRVELGNGDRADPCESKFILMTVLDPL